jgi:TonB family protein
MGMKKILVIDYDQSSLAAIQGVLAKEGFQVVTAGDGQAGWDKYNKESPDLILMEAMLPKVHGFELCQRITSERNSQTTVFMMTGVYKDRVYRTEALRTYGASEYFEKPLKMAELLASIEAVLGKPEPPPAEPEPVVTKPAAAPPAPPKPARSVQPEPVLVEPPRRPERPKPARDEFALPADLDLLSKEIPKEVPKARKPAPAPREAPMDARLESLADEILKTVVPEPVPHKAVAEKPKNNNGNGHEAADIDQFIKSALAGFDLSQEKVKVPKTAPLPTPPPPPPAMPKPAPQAAPVVEKPVEKPIEKPAEKFVEKQKPAAQTTLIEKLKPLDLPSPEVVFSKPDPMPTVTLTPGDPGSDSSPFFTPEKAKPTWPREAAPAPAPIPFRPVAKPKVVPPPPPVAAAPAPKPPKPEPPKPEPAAEVKVVPAAMFTEHLEAPVKKRFPTVLAAGLGVAVLAAAAFLFLRPKKAAAPIEDSLRTAQTAVQANVPQTKIEEPPAEAPKPKPKAPRPKVETQTKVADIGPSAEDAIILPTQSVAIPPAGPPSNAAANPGTQTSQAETPPAKTEGNPALEGAETSTTATNPGTAADGGTSAAPVPPAVPVKEGDLVDLASVDEQPRNIKSAQPVYPAAAQRLGVEGSITVNALIDETGAVIDTGVLKGLKDDRGLGKAAETAVKKWKFQPARKGGVAVKVWKPFVIVFKAGEKTPGMVE